MTSPAGVIVEVLDDDHDVVAWLGSDGLTPARWEARRFASVAEARIAARSRALSGVGVRITADSSAVPA